MAITDELRAWAHGPDEGDDWLDRIDEFYDRIDAEHERAMREEYQRGANDGYDMGFASADDWLAQHEDAMAEHGWVKMPVDAEGKPIRIGDVMEWCDSGETLTVEGIGRDVLFYIDGENAEWTAARNKRHHHAPTVEDVLDEFANAVLGCDNTEESVQRVIDDYAKRLRLAEEVDA